MNGRERGEKELLSSFLWFDERRSITCRLVTAEVFLAQFFLLFMVLLFAGKGLLCSLAILGKLARACLGAVPSLFPVNLTVGFVFVVT